MSLDNKPVGLLLVSQFEKAIRAHEMMGAGPPEDYDEIERRYKKAKRRLLDLMIRARPDDILLKEAVEEKLRA